MITIENDPPAWSKVEDTRSVYQREIDVHSLSNYALLETLSKYPIYEKEYSKYKIYAASNGNKFSIIIFCLHNGSFYAAMFAYVFPPINGNEHLDDKCFEVRCNSDNKDERKFCINLLLQYQKAFFFPQLGGTEV